MEILFWYIIASYILTLILAIIMALDDYSSNKLNYSLSNIFTIISILVFAPITFWIVTSFIINKFLPKDFWTRPIIKIKKKQL